MNDASGEVRRIYLQPLASPNRSKGAGLATRLMSPSIFTASR